MSKKGGFLANQKLLIAATTLIGTIVGAGILGIPYVVAKAGFLYGFLFMLIIGFSFLFLNLFAGEVVLRTKKQHQLTGYAEKYLGKKGKIIMTFAMLISIYGALTAYLIGEGSTLGSIFGVPSLIPSWLAPHFYTIIFFIIAVFIVCKGIKTTGKAELFLITTLLVIVVLIGFFSFNGISSSNFTTFNPVYFFLPYGVILFAFMGTPAIPEVQEQLGKQKKKMKLAIIIGSLTPIILYLIFTIIIVGIIGEANFDLLQPNERIATIALSIYSYQILGVFANILAVLAMFTSFLTLGLALSQVYEYDYGISKKVALFLTFSLPLLITLLDLTSFIAVLGMAGAIAGGIDAILVVLMYWKSKLLGDRKPEYTLRKHKILGTILIIMFSFGIFYQIWQSFF